MQDMRFDMAELYLARLTAATAQVGHHCAVLLFRLVAIEVGEGLPLKAGRIQHHTIEIEDQGVLGEAGGVTGARRADVLVRAGSKAAVVHGSVVPCFLAALFLQFGCCSFVLSVLWFATRGPGEEKSKGPRVAGQIITSLSFETCQHPALEWRVAEQYQDGHAAEDQRQRVGKQGQQELTTLVTH